MNVSSGAITTAPLETGESMDGGGRIERAEGTDKKERRRLNKLARRGRNRKFLFDFIRFKSCADCGLADFRVLTLDFPNQRIKHVPVHVLINLAHSLKFFSQELKKAQVTCFNCLHKRASARSSSKMIKI